MYVFSEEKQFSFEKVGIKGKVFPIDHVVTSTEVVLIETTHGHETTIRQKKSDFLYYILDGQGSFTIEDEAHPCKIGDLVAIPAGKAFRYDGTLKMLLVVTPPWSEDQEETLGE